MDSESTPYTHADLHELETKVGDAKSLIENNRFTFNEDTTQLSFVDLSNNKDLKEIFIESEQTHLRYIDASSCAIEKIVIKAGCPALQTLYLQSNPKKSIEITGACSKLELIDLSQCQLKQITLPEKNLPELKYLYLRENELVDLTLITWFFTQKDVAVDFVITENKGLQTPPAEIVGQGKGAVVRYFELLKKEQETDEKPQYLFEVKMLVIGEGGTGKTTLIKKLQNEQSALPKDEDTTIGIDIDKWTFPLDLHMFRHLKDLSQTEMHVNCWDFGGQKVYHGTHQIFFGENSLYVLVSDTREQKTDFSYWFNTIEQLAGDNATVFVIINHKHGHTLQFDRDGYGKRFRFVANDMVRELDLKNNVAEIIKLQALVKNRLMEMPQIGKPIAATYIHIRESLLELNKPYLSFDRFQEICDSHGLNEYEDVRIMSKYFHEIGAITHFIDDDLLRTRVYLNSNWLVKTLYKVLDDKSIKQEQGRICLKDAEQIWKLDKLDFEVSHLAQLMHKFGLMYKVTTRDEFVIPAHLPTEKPYLDWKHANGSGVLLFRYEFDKYMPEGLMSHFIVSLHNYIENEVVWHRGVNLISENSYAEIVETYGGTNTFEIRITGAQKREMLAIIRHNFKEILKPFKKLDYKELIPCNCIKCKDAEIPYFHEYKILQEFVAGNDEQIQCLKSRKLVSVKGLLDDVIIEKHDFEPEYNIKNIGTLLKESFNDVKFQEFCMFHFPEVQSDWGSESDKTQKIMALIDYCKRHRQIDALLRLLENENPAQFDVHKPYR